MTTKKILYSLNCSFPDGNSSSNFSENVSVTTNSIVDHKSSGWMMASNVGVDGEARYVHDEERGISEWGIRSAADWQ